MSALSCLIRCLGRISQTLPQDSSWPSRNRTRPGDIDMARGHPPLGVSRCVIASLCVSGAPHCGDLNNRSRGIGLVKSFYCTSRWQDENIIKFTATGRQTTATTTTFEMESVYYRKPLCLHSRLRSGFDIVPRR